MSIPVFNTDKYDRYYAPLMVPYKPGTLEIDEEAYRKLIRYFTTSKSFLEAKGSLVVNPEAGEIFYLTPEERKRLIKIVLEERVPEMPVFAGCFGVRMDEVIACALDAKSAGADGIFVMAPAGTMEVSTNIDGERNPEVWTEYVRAIAEATQLPLIIHPSHPDTAHWGRALPLPTVKMVLEEIPSVVGWKMIYGNSTAHFRVARYIRSLPRHVGILNAPQNSYHTALMCDLLDGALDGRYNFVMEGKVEHSLAWHEGDIPRAKKAWNNLVVPVCEHVYSDYSRLHLRYKLATWIRGFLPHPFMRPPMPAPRRDEAERIYEGISTSGLSCISRSTFDEVLGQKDRILRRPAL